MAVITFLEVPGPDPLVPARPPVTLCVDCGESFNTGYALEIEAHVDRHGHTVVHTQFGRRLRYVTILEMRPDLVEF